MTTKEFCRLIEKLKNNDIGALKILYEEYFQRIYTTAYSILKDRNDAYDVAMDVFLKLIEYPSDPYKIKNHVGLIIVMAKNAAFNFINKNLHYTNSSKIEELCVSSEDNNSLWIEDIIRQLTEEERYIFVEHFIWGKKLKNIATERGKSYITIKRTFAIVKYKIKQVYS